MESANTETNFVQEERALMMLIRHKTKEDARLRDETSTFTFSAGFRGKREGFDFLAGVSLLINEDSV